MIVVGVPSLNTDKLKPTHSVFTRLFGDMVTIFGDKSPSLVNEQPEGDEEILRGAKNREKHFIDTHYMSGFDYLVTFENGIKSVTVFGEVQWYDYVWVIVLDCKTGKRTYAFGQGVRFPTKYVLETKHLGFDMHTVGSVIASNNAGANASDPHSFLTGGRIKRTDILEQTLLVALSQLLADK